MAVRTEEGADPAGFWTAIVGLITAVLVIASVVGLQALYYKVHDDEVARKVMSARSTELVRVQSEQNENLNSYRWVDEKAQRAAIPIANAMELFVREQRNQRNSVIPAGRTYESGGQ